MGDIAWDLCCASPFGPTWKKGDMQLETSFTRANKSPVKSPGEFTQFYQINPTVEGHAMKRKMRSKRKGQVCSFWAQAKGMGALPSTHSPKLTL